MSYSPEMRIQARFIKQGPRCWNIISFIPYCPAREASAAWVKNISSLKGITSLYSQADQLLSQLGITACHPIVHTGNNRKVPPLFHQLEQVLREGLPSCDLQAGGYMRLLLAEYAKKHMSPSFQQKIATPQQQLVEQAIRFTDALYFSKQFRKWYGCSPSEYKAGHFGSAYDCSK